MKKTLTLLIPLVCLLFFSIADGAIAGDEERMMVRIPHEFTVGEKALPSGRYSVSTDEDDPGRLHIHNMAGESCAWLPVITRLSQHAHEDTKARMVFDRVGGQVYLSEVWLSGEDGYLVRGTPKEHSHEIVHFGG